MRSSRVSRTIGMPRRPLLLVSAIFVGLTAMVASSTAAMAATKKPPAITLEQLGRPSILGSTCDKYKTAAQGADLVVRGTPYKNGFQLTAPQTCTQKSVRY